MTSSRRNGSKATPRWRRAAPTTPSSSSRAATRSTIVWVSNTQSATCSAGMARLELAQQVGEHDAARAGRGADLERAAQLLAAGVGDLGDDLFLQREQALGAAIEPHAGLGRLDAPARAVEELRPEPLLERADLQADRRLGDPEPLGGLREAAPLDHRAERRKLHGCTDGASRGTYLTS